MTPDAAAGIGPGVEALLATRCDRLSVELAALAAAGRSSPGLRALATGDPEALRRLAAAIRGYHDAAVAPLWAQVRAQFDADIAVRTRRLLEGGTDRLLTTLHPAVTWRLPVLEVHGMPVDGMPVERDVRLDGSGLRLIPSYFCVQGPVVLTDPGLPQVLVYPIEHEATTLDPDPPAGSFGSLAPLGTTPGWTLDGDATFLPAESRRRALLARIHLFIDRHLGDPGLTPAAIAAAHSISVSYLHKLFHDQGLTVAAMIRRRRLERIHRDLADPLLAARPVHAIAARWGFTSAAHFSRSFRSAFGLSPQQYRRSAAPPSQPGV